MLLALPAFGQTFDNTYPKGDRYKTLTWTTGETGDSDAIQSTDCASWKVSAVLPNGATANVYALEASDSAASSGVLRVAVTTTTTEPVTVNTGLPYLKVDVLTAPSSGTAKLFFYCQRESAAVEHPLAIVGDALTDASMSRIAQMKQPAVMEWNGAGDFHTYWFSTAAGGDVPADGSATGNGSFDMPFDETLLDDYCGKPGVICRVDGEGGDPAAVYALGATVTFALATCPPGLCSVVMPAGDSRPTITSSLTAAFDATASTSTTAWGAVIGIHCIATNGDCFATSSTDPSLPNMLWMNTSASVTGNASDNGYTVHRGGNAVALNSSALTASGSTNDNPAIAIVHGADAYFGNVSARTSANVATHDAVFIGNSSVAGVVRTMLDTGFVDRGPGATTGDAAIEINADSLASTETHAQLIHVGARADAGTTGQCIRVVISGSTDIGSLRMRGVSASGCADGILLPSGAVDAGARFDIVGSGYMADDVTDDCIGLDDADWATSLSIDISESLCDDDDSATVFTITGGTPATADTWTAFQTGVTSIATRLAAVTTGNLISNDAQVQWSNGTQVFPGLECQSINDCYQSADAAWSETLPVEIPEWVFDTTTPIKRRIGGGLNGNIGR
jgi:hypothetical protein